MENQQKIPDIPLDTDDQFLEPFYNKPRFTSTFWRSVFMVAVLLTAVLYFKIGVIDDSFKPEELRGSIQLTDVSSQWILREKIDSKDFKGVVVVPELSFRLKNIGKRKLRFVYFLGVFRYSDNGKSFGEGSLMTVKKNLAVGAQTETLKLQCSGGYTATSLDSFLKNRKEWKNVFVDLFVSCKNSGKVSVNQFFISQKIEGQDVEVKLK